MQLIKRSALFLLLFCLGCSAQSGGPADLNHRVERMVRSHYTDIPSTVVIQVGTPHPSTDFAGWDVVPVTLTFGGKSNTTEFLLSKDGKRLVKTTSIEDPLEKIDTHGRPSRGAANAKVTVVTYDDFQCPFCAQNHQMLFSQLLKQYGDRVRFIYKDYPLAEIHPWATRAALDANCLFDQSNDAYWDFADYVHANQREITGTKRPLPEQFEALDKLAAENGAKRGVDAPRLQACLKAQPDTALKASLKEAAALGINATPSMYVNGLKIPEGMAPAEIMHAVIDQALRDAGQPAGPAAGTASVTPPGPATQNH